MKHFQVYPTLDAFAHYSLTPEILFMTYGQLNSGEGHFADQVGLCHLPVPTSPTPHQGLAQVTHGEVYGV